MSTLEGKVALVTGSTSGIGLGIATALADAGAHVMLNGFGEAAEIERTRAELAAQTGRTVGHSGADMSRPEEIAALVEETRGQLGSLDVLVNNAGIQHVCPVDEFPRERWEAILAINLTACFHTIRAALPGMRERGWGRIVNVASVHGLVASAGKSAYVAAKHGLVGLTKVVALESAGTGVTCNAICPGWVLTPLGQQQVDAYAEREGVSDAEARAGLLAEKQPSRTFATPEQIGALAAFLCSDAAEQVTGASVPVDGDWTAQ